MDYYTRLEQGRPITPSESVLDALANALQLDPAERVDKLAVRYEGDCQTSGPVLLSVVTERAVIRGGCDGGAG
ncbi:hypothetical protein GCM10018780_89550 [Streptomyces lanatus]|nr:hypothetical protein GCM10018780_89550 [Streptomyces lanatus]